MKASIVFCVLVGLVGCSSTETDLKEEAEVVVEDGKDSESGESVLNDMNSAKTVSDQRESGVQVEIIEESKECSR